MAELVDDLLLVIASSMGSDGLGSRHSGRKPVEPVEATPVVIVVEINSIDMRIRDLEKGSESS